MSARVEKLGTHPLTEAVRRRAPARFDPAGRREWAALVRELDAGDTSYRG